MKHFKTIILAAAALMATACSNKESYMAQIATSSPSSYYFANNTGDTLAIFSSGGSWKATAQDAGTWCTLNPMSGKGYMTYVADVKMEQNTTGTMRRAIFKIEDADHPGEAHRTVVFNQMAIRGDGSFGSAAMVSRIMGTDGTDIQIAYDDLHRPNTLKMEKGGTVIDDLTFDYDDRSNTLIVKKGVNELSGTYDVGYQPWTLSNASYSIGIVENELFNMYSNSSYAFNIDERKPDNAANIYYYLINKIQNHPDSIHNADSLKYQKAEGGKSVLIEEMGLSYSSTDNRYQSVDANQLLLGIDHCNPFMLVGMFRYARNSQVISLAKCKNEADNISITTEVNADKSIKTLTVTRHGAAIIYTFHYE